MDLTKSNHKSENVEAALGITNNALRNIRADSTDCRIPPTRPEPFKGWSRWSGLDAGRLAVLAVAVPTQGKRRKEIRSKLFAAIRDEDVEAAVAGHALWLVFNFDATAVRVLRTVNDLGEVVEPLSVVPITGAIRRLVSALENGGDAMTGRTFAEEVAKVTDKALSDPEVRGDVTAITLALCRMTHEERRRMSATAYAILAVGRLSCMIA